jgi:RNA polymerase sigma factor (TIGR02999 family)
LLGEWSNGDERALEKLLPLVQPEWHRLAHHYMNRERPGHRLQTTAILNEAYLRLVDDTKPVWQGRSHFIAVAAQLMRRIMVDHARKRHSLKRGGGALKVTLDEAALVTETRSQELLDLHEALERLGTGGILLLSEPITLRYALASLTVLGGIALVIVTSHSRHRMVMFRRPRS